MNSQVTNYGQIESRGQKLVNNIKRIIPGNSLIGSTTTRFYQLTFYAAPLHLLAGELHRK